MTVSTSGLELQTRSRGLRDAVELVSSMRFSISLLTLICIASVVGTVVKQHEPFNNYVNQFGPFWAAAVRHHRHLCGVRRLVVPADPGLPRHLDQPVHRAQCAEDRRRPEEPEGAPARAVAAGVPPQGARPRLAEPRDAAFARIAALLSADGWRAKADVRDNGTMIAARKGAVNRLGYLAAHSAIVLICLGGLVDGNLIVRAQMALQGKSTLRRRRACIGDMPAAHRLGSATPTFRANLLVPEGARANTAVLNLEDGVVLQELPFDVELKKFIVEYYATGMPKLFASEIVIHDHATGQAIPATVKVNEPAHHRGVAIYQSSFDDGGSSVTLRALPLDANAEPFEIERHHRQRLAAVATATSS